MNSEALLNKKEAFILRFGEEVDDVKRQVHYQSVINMTDALLNIKNKRESDLYKQKIYEYFEEISNYSLPIDQLSSLKLFREYLQEISLYLMSKANFRSTTDFQRAIIWGIIFDLLLFLIFSSIFGYFLPIFTLFFGLKAYSENKTALKENRYFGRRY
ncbi:hypothetical protein [Psychroflexus halocasei]|uniref:Uncharacterized protein n=1 Tax=Psychroflexus halocasei TaxID=908615 RepID=A0A1H4DSR2_9FLAO|nr:hypothetical protein [Psychroflexus halocasei]SEA75450.1 hypothetical protein SAMN05421540_11412 [Psychroflexus halocasei]